jgi:hypothetical protein
LFWDIPYSEPVWLSGAISQREIAANSTYREAKVKGRVGRGSGRGLWEGKWGVVGWCRHSGRIGGKKMMMEKHTITNFGEISNYQYKEIQIFF